MSDTHRRSERPRLDIRRVTALGLLCALSWAQAAAAQTTAPPASGAPVPTAGAPVPTAGAPVPTAGAGAPPSAAAPAAAGVPAADGPPPSAAGPSAPPSAAAPEPPAAPAPSAPAPAVAVAPAAPPPSAAGAPRHTTQDRERPPRPAEPLLGPKPNTFVARLAIGIEASLLTLDGPAALQTPPIATLDLGYAPSTELVLWLRLYSWLAYDQYGFQFIGLGASYLYVEEQMFITGIIGLSIADNSLSLPGGDSDRVQGLTAHFEIGQQWPIAEMLSFQVGVHFELATPWLGKAYDAAAIGVGPFIAISYR